MALRKSSVLTGLFALGFSCWVTALGLGELTLHSALDEPFEADIEIVNIGEVDENQIFVALGSKADFERAGVPWEFHLVNLTFKVDLSDAEHPVVKVSSRQSIQEPYLDFVTQLEWPSGRLLREYTLFLDLPVFDDNKAPAHTESTLTAPAAKTTSPGGGSKNQSSAEGKSSTRSTATTAAGSNSTKYRVRGGDTLWKIASREELGSTSVQQRMVAIHRANPRAFVNGNANLLKKGAVLRMPGLEGTESINPREALQVVADQSRAWSEQHKNRAVRELIGDVPGAVAKKKPAPEEGLLRLSTPTAGSASTGSQLGRTAGGEGSSTGSQSLQSELGLAQEELDRSKRENLELKAKLAGLEAQLNTTSKLLEIESDELKAVQLGVRVRDSVVDIEAKDSAKKAVTEALAVADSPAEPSPGTGEPGPGSEGVTSAPVSGLFAFLQSNWMPLLGLVAVLLGVLLLISKSKKEDESDSLEPFISPMIEDAEADQQSSVAVDEVVEERASIAAEPVSLAPDSLDVAPAEVLEEVDPIGEADIYASLGNYSEAESVIEKALVTAPNDSKLHLKRLDLFAAQQDGSGFDAYYPTLVALGDEAATATADRLRANITEPVLAEEDAEPRELTLEEQVAEELGIADLELDLSGVSEPQAESVDDIVTTDIDAELDSSFVESGESELDLSDVELDLSEIELDLKPGKTTTVEASEEPDDELEEALFGDISLPDELDDLASDISSEDSSAELDLPILETDELELPDLASEGSDLSEAELDGEDVEGLELSLDSFDFDNDDDLDLEIGEDESNTQLELAQAYIDMGDASGAKDILAGVLSSGSNEQQQQANELLAKLA
ncbi:hypothetical protein A9Q90_01795 [Gammaproteobacteria bacterium 54_18_T64]|nr:hypothetical protein A9Q90_01795 [Gammaproteobacteria bacterium 54_18_T64]